MKRKPATLKDVRSRITEVRRVRASDLQPHPSNWRQHGEAQVSAMAGVMQEVGDVGVLLAWVSEREGGKLTLIDGHLRAGIAPDHEYMVAVTDLTDAEADYVLTTHDPLSAMASADAAALDALLSSVSTGDDAVKRMMDDLAKDAGIFHEDEGADAEDIPDDSAADDVDALLAPFPWFGGKARVAGRVWRRFGEVDNYVEPFCGSAAVLLACPYDLKVSTINDVDGYVSNFWRSIHSAPDDVAQWADWPVNENDLFARHVWLIRQNGELTRQLETSPDYFDAKIAGWWVWGCCSWIGTGWCSGSGPWTVEDGQVINTNGNAGRGVNRQLPHLGNAGRGVNRQLPHLGDAGQGVNRQLPHLGDAGRGVNRQLPHLGDAGRGVCEAASHHLKEYMRALSDKLRTTRVACGDWSRVVTPSVTFRHGLTAVLLDPPYGDGAVEYSGGGNGDKRIAVQVRQWCIENGNDPQMRIALCGYDDVEMPSGWSVMRWKARKGYQVADNDQSHRETIWFSPHCKTPTRIET